MIQIRKKRYPRARQPRLVGFPLHLFLRRIFSTRKHVEFPHPARDGTTTASPVAAVFPHSPASRHGNRHLCSRRRAGAQGQHGQTVSVIKPGDVQYMSAGTGVAQQRVQTLRTRSPCTCTRSGCFPDKTGLHPRPMTRSISAPRKKQGQLRLVVFGRRPRRLCESPPGQ